MMCDIVMKLLATTAMLGLVMSAFGSFSAADDTVEAQLLFYTMPAEVQLSYLPGTPMLSSSASFGIGSTCQSVARLSQPDSTETKFFETTGVSSVEGRGDNYAGTASFSCNENVILENTSDTSVSLHVYLALVERSSVQGGDSTPQSGFIARLSGGGSIYDELGQMSAMVAQTMSLGTFSPFAYTAAGQWDATNGTGTKKSYFQGFEHFTEIYVDGYLTLSPQQSDRFFINIAGPASALVPQAVPEPGSVYVLLSGAAAFLRWKRRDSSK